MGELVSTWCQNVLKCCQLGGNCAEIALCGQGVCLGLGRPHTSHLGVNVGAERPLLGGLET